MARPVKFAHVVYMTRRYDEMIAWYEDVFEAHAVHRDAFVWDISSSYPRLRANIFS